MKCSKMDEGAGNYLKYKKFKDKGIDTVKVDADTLARIDVASKEIKAGEFVTFKMLKRNLRKWRKKT